jgi:hypothetical protein
MDLPHRLMTLRILGRDVPVYEEDGLDQGGFCYDEMAIYLNSNYPEAHRKETLLHEVMHALIWIMGWGGRFDDWDKRREECGLEEDFVASITPALFQVLRDNRGLI